MTNEKKNNRLEFDVQEWFKKLDRFNTVEPFVFEREQPVLSERESLDEDRTHTVQTTRKSTPSD